MLCTTAAVLFYHNTWSPEMHQVSQRHHCCSYSNEV